MWQWKTVEKYTEYIIKHFLTVAKTRFILLLACLLSAKTCAILVKLERKYWTRTQISLFQKARVVVLARCWTCEVAITVKWKSKTYFQDVAKFFPLSSVNCTGCSVCKPSFQQVSWELGSHATSSPGGPFCHAILIANQKHRRLWKRGWQSCHSLFSHLVTQCSCWEEFCVTTQKGLRRLTSHWLFNVWVVCLFCYLKLYLRWVSLS